MNAKLTLTIEREVLEKAREYAKETGQSLSDIVEKYFSKLGRKEDIPKTNAQSSRIRKLKGILKVDEDFDYKKVLAEELAVKYEA